MPAANKVNQKVVLYFKITASLNIWISIPLSTEDKEIMRIGRVSFGHNERKLIYFPGGNLKCIR
jgi:hypothetical protein